VVDKKLTILPVTLDSLVRVSRSVNQVSLAIPGHDAENAQAFVVGHRQPSGAFSIFVYILLDESATPVVYVSNGPPVAQAQFASLEGEAMAFVESMGFMLDNLHFETHPVEEKRQLFTEFPFTQRQPNKIIAEPIDEIAGQIIEDGGELGASERHALCRLLAAF
jgi:hypothetical protein